MPRPSSSRSAHARRRTAPATRSRRSRSATAPAWKTPRTTPPTCTRRASAPPAPARPPLRSERAYTRAMLGLPDAVTALLFDLDGVLTDTASVHQRAWKEMFDDYLRE